MESVSQLQSEIISLKDLYAVFNQQLQHQALKTDQALQLVQAVQLQLAAKADGVDLEFIRNQQHSFVKYADIEFSNRQLQEQLYKISDKFQHYDFQITSLKKQLNDLDYSLLSKASKMDIQMLETQHHLAKKKQAELSAKVDELIEDHKAQKALYHELIKQECVLIFNQLRDNLKNYLSNQMLEQFKQYIAKFEITGMIADYKAIKQGISQKADQSQIAEILQLKADQSQLNDLQQKQVNTKSVIKQMLDSLIVYVEALHSHEDSYNMRRSDMAKAIMLLKQLQSKIRPLDLKEQSEDPKAFSKTQIVKLRPVLYRASASQKRAKTEINDD